MGLSNDFEIIYLIQDGNETALLDLQTKYNLFIWKMIHDVNVPISEQDDFFQEAQYLLYSASKIFDIERNKTFTRYFELILKRKFFYLLTKLKTNVLQISEEQINSFSEESSLTNNRYSIYNDRFVISYIKDKLNSKTSMQILNLYFLKNLSYEEISKILKLKEKTIYNAVYKIRKIALELLDSY
ncbi:MAG: hypothetical protein LBV58_03695 [Acholeplasmatales bacterium]|jgi:RNA polymerase sporulation-specific sigma factor|nr:hypothetical protein [Acholeplasmatales bacterium]